ncbi:DEAD/DEAH box helicase family protein [uncultured Parolsenella sp.]|uniref:DEAD/DEAH box helicase family protein n=1 Tax=uncultured Parolsenella sp. TaxID=2083008 RepID=UPI0027D99C8B|nr:DEAD/DEAH box helicase family protein [uncultured Parolsenella sp.]
MQFKFTIQPYQTDAADAVASVFAGQPCQAPFENVRDLGSGRADRTGTVSLVDQMTDDAGYANAPVRLSEAELLDNVRAQQRRFSVPESSSLAKGPGAAALDVEMETGTGKTYVYTKTIFELNRRFGWSKFVIVVPSVAIREGVAKSLAVTEGHFFVLYGKRIWSSVYNSSRLNEIDQFAQRADISVMVINTQNFNKSMKEGGTSKDALVMFSERDDFGSRRPIDVLAATRPVIISGPGRRGVGRRERLRPHLAQQGASALL